MGLLVTWITKTSKPNRPAIAKWSRLAFGRTTKGHTAANAGRPRTGNVKPYGARVVCDSCGAEGPAVVERFMMRDVTDIGEHERNIERHSAGMEKASALWDGRAT